MLAQQAVGQLEGVDGARPFCTGDGVGAVLSVIGPRDARGNVVTRRRWSASTNRAHAPSSPSWRPTRGAGRSAPSSAQDYSVGQIVPIRGAASASPAVPADAVTASGSGLDPDISPAYADMQVARVAKARAVSAPRSDPAGRRRPHTDGRDLGFLGEPRVNVVELNLALDQKYPVKS